MIQPDNSSFANPEANSEANSQVHSDVTPEANLQAGASKAPVIRIFGVGGAGCNAVGSMTFTEPGDYVALNTDSQALAQCRVERKILLGSKRTRGLSAGGDPEVGRSAAEDDLEMLRELCKGADLVFVIAGLGGGTGTGAAPVLAHAAREAGALVLAVAALPFDFEGGRRQRQAQLGLQQLKSEADAVICLPNQKLFKLIDTKSSVLECFRISDGLFAQGVLGVRRMLSSSGLINNVDLATLRSVTQGLHSESSLAIAEAAGEKRVDTVLEKLMAHPLLDGRVLDESNAVLVSLVSGEDLTMAEVDRFMEQINRKCEGANVIVGTTINPAFAHRLSVTLVASGSQEQEMQVPAPASRIPVERSITPEAASAPLSAPELSEPEDSAPRTSSRFAAPAPNLPPERREQLLRSSGRSRRKLAAILQRELPLEMISRGRFEKSEPTIRHGEDLDVPTYIRRRVVMN